MKRITTTQLAVLGCVAEGLKAREGAARLHMPTNTYRTHVQNLHQRLGAHTNAQAVAIAYKQGIFMPQGRRDHMQTPQTRDHVLIAYLLDRSGSMQQIKSDVIGGFNQFLKDQKAEPGSCRFVLTLFDSTGIDTTDYSDIKLVPEFTEQTYKPRDATPLFDAIGKTVQRVDELGGDPRVIFVIHTDGLENASSEYTRSSVFSLVTECQGPPKDWEFIFLGVGMDAYAAGQQVGVPMVQTVSTAYRNTGATYAATSGAVSDWRRGATAGQSMSNYQQVKEKDSRPKEEEKESTSP